MEYKCETMTTATAWRLCNKHMRVICGRVSQFALQQTELNFFRILDSLFCFQLTPKEFLYEYIQANHRKYDEIIYTNTNTSRNNK